MVLETQNLSDVSLKILTNNMLIQIIEIKLLYMTVVKLLNMLIQIIEI